MIMWLARMLLLRRFGGRGLLLFGLLNFLRRRIGGRRARGVYEPGAEPLPKSTGTAPVETAVTPLEPGDLAPGETDLYQPSQGSSQTVQRSPR